MHGITNQIWLLADAGTVITILVMFLYFVSWVVQKVAENKNVPPPKNRPARQLPAPQAKELDEFLKRARRGQNPNLGPRPDADMIEGRELLEVVEEEPPRRQRPLPAQPPREPKRQKQKQRPRPQPQTFAPAPPEAIEIGAKALAPPVTSRRRESENAPAPPSPLNQLQDHLSAYMETGRIEKSVAEHLPSLMGQLRSQLQQTETPTADIAAAPIDDAQSVRHAIIEMFHRPQQIRQAIIVNEILQRPRSVRRE